MSDERIFDATHDPASGMGMRRHLIPTVVSKQPPTLMDRVHSLEDSVSDLADRIAKLDALHAEMARAYDELRRLVGV